MSATQFHPTAKILFWLLLALWSPLLAGAIVLGISGALLVANLLLGRAAVWRRLWRMRWLWLGIVLLYGLSQPLWTVWLGWQDGLLQALRVVSLLLLFSLLMGGLARDQLLAGLYLLLKPLTFLRVPVERGVLRVGMAVRYIEALDSLKWQDLGRLETILNDLPDLPSTVSLELPDWAWRDTLLVLGGMVLGGMLL